MVRPPKRIPTRQKVSGKRIPAQKRQRPTRSRKKSVTMRTDDLSWSAASEKLKKAGRTTKKVGKAIGGATLDTARAGVKAGEAYFDWVDAENQRIAERNLRTLDARVKRAKARRQLLKEEAELEDELAQLRMKKTLAQRKRRMMQELEDEDEEDYPRPRPRKKKSSSSGKKNARKRSGM